MLKVACVTVMSKCKAVLTAQVVCRGGDGVRREGEWCGT